MRTRVLLWAFDRAMRSRSRVRLYVLWLALRTLLSAAERRDLTARWLRVLEDAHAAPERIG